MTVHLPPYTEDDVKNCRPWLANLRDADLEVWLRRALFAGRTAPAAVPEMERLAAFLGDLFLKMGPEFSVRVKEIIPSLIREWQESDGHDVLEELLLLAEHLRSTDAEDSIIQLFRNRVSESPEDIAIRQRSLQALATFGVQSESESETLFRSLIGKINYSALAYRALYKLRAEYGADLLPKLIDVYEPTNRRRELREIVAIFALHTHVDSLEVILLRLLKSAPVNKITSCLSLLQEIGVFAKGRDPLADSDVFVFEVTGIAPHVIAPTKRIEIPLSDLQKERVSKLIIFVRERFTGPQVENMLRS